MDKEDTKFPGLFKLCKALDFELGYSFNVYDVVYFIRHVSIAVGCKNNCSHCFSNAPISISQTSLQGFARIIKEIGEIVAINNNSLPFFHLGASNDPAFVKNYYSYLLEWRKAMPSFQQIKVFSHGWNLRNDIQVEEFQKYLSVLEQYSNIKAVISFDSFSKLARANWDIYIQNISQNLNYFISSIGRERIRIEVFYTPERLSCNPKYTLEYWRELILKGNCLSIQDIIEEIDGCNENNDCAKVTCGLLKVFHLCGLKATDLINMSRDCESIFPAGRGKQFFNNLAQDNYQKGLEIQKKRVLYSLKDYIHKYMGVIILPDGTCQTVNYHGYKAGKILNHGQPIIQYMSLI